MKPNSILSFLLGLTLGCASFACGQQLQVATNKSKQYEDDVAMCRAHSQNCPDMVICQHNAQRQYGYPFSGKCNGEDLTDYAEADGGSDAH